MAQDVGQEIERAPQSAEQLKSLWQAADTQWLKKYYSTELASRNMQEAHDHPLLAFSRLGYGEHESPVKPGHFIIVTQSPEKLQLVSEVVQKLGGIAQAVAFSDEESAKRWKQEFVRRWGSGVYSLVIADEKTLGLKREAFREGKTLISSDSVVSVNRKILEKPEDTNDIEQNLKTINGRKIKVRVAVNAFVPIRFGQVALRLDEGAEISLKARDLNDNEIAKYIEINKEHALEVAGGIDFSTTAGQQLIDGSEPIQVKPLGSTIYDLYCKNRNINRKPVTIDAQNVGLITDYFKGAPQDIITVLMRQAQEIQEQIERL